MLDLGQLVFGHIFQLIISVIDNKLKSSALSFLEQRKIRRRVEDATAQVVESLVPFLEQEKIAQEKQERLIETCISELKPFTQNPTELFKGSLDGQKIFENLYHERGLPQVIVEDGLKDTYSLLFPRIATLLCKIPAAVNDWESEAWSENYRRFDEVVAQLRTLFARVDELADVQQKGADATLIQIKRMLAQKVGLQLDITGLRADQPYSGKFDDFFVLPEIKRVSKDDEAISITEADDCVSTFTTSNCLSVVLGAPGVGKSTWSKWLQRETLRAEWKGIGIRIEFRDLKADELPSTYDLVRRIAGKQFAEDLTSEKLKRWLDDWHIVFILDGFDEVKPTDRDTFVDWIREIMDYTKGCPIVVTSRPLTTNHLSSLGDDWDHWTIEPFGETRIISYISKWYANSPLLTDSDREINAQELAKDWLRDPTIGPLTGNPLLLSTLLMVHHLDGKLPHGRANLYKRYVDGMLGLWDDRHKLSATDIQLNPDEKRKIIRGIALHLFLTQQDTIDENILVNWLNGFLPTLGVKYSAHDVLLILRERTGLIVGPGIYNFAHKTIAEFLVAETVLDGVQKDIDGRRIDRFTLLQHRDDDRWNVVIFLWSGIAPAIDVISFVEHSVTDKKYSLAFGILFDQYDRISAENRRQIILKIRSIQDFEESNRQWGVSGWPAGHKRSYGVPTGGLRSLTDVKFLHNITVEDLLRRAIEDRTITWKDYKLKKNEIGWLLFLIFSTTPTSEWKTVLESYTDWIGHQVYKKAARKPKRVKARQYVPAEDEVENTMNMSEMEWGYLVAGRAFGWWVVADNMDLVSLYNIYNDLFPQFSGFVSLSLISELVDMANGRGGLSTSKQFADTFIDQSIDIILSGDLNRLSNSYLLGTNDWRFWTTQGEKSQGESKTDLFNVFRLSIDKLLDLGLLKQEKYDNLMNLINTLELRRSLIESEK